MNNFTGYLHFSLAYSSLQNLQFTDLSLNNVVDQIPPQIIYLNSLDTLNLSPNHINGNIPVEICNISDIIIDLSHNFISGEIPVSLSIGSERTYFHGLNLSYNNLTGRIPILQG